MAASSSTRGNHEDVISSPTGISESDGHSEYEINMDNSIYDSDKVDDSSFSSCLMTETKEKFTSQFSLPKMRKLIDKLTDAQKDIVTMCGFGSLLHLKCTHVPKQLVYWLAKNYDAKSKSVKLPGGGSFSLDSFTVHQILGIPFRGRQVQKKATKRAKDLIGKDTGSAVTGAKVDDLLKIVTPDLLGDKFARIFMLIALSLFLCPSSNTRTIPHFYSALCVVKEIASYDWSSMVLDWLVGKIKNFQVAASKGNTCGVVSLGGCIFVLFAAYFDYLDTSEVKVEGSNPRLISWDDDAVQAYELIDRKFQEAKFKSIESTLFDKKHAIPVNFRGYGVLDGGSGSVSRARGKQSALRIGKPPPPMGNTEHIKSIQRSRLLKSQVDKGNVEASLPACPSHMNSTRIVSNVAKCNTHLAGCSKVSVSANDDGIHPDVEDFINNTITGSNNEHVRIKMREMCKQFRKTSIDRCVEALQPVIAQQSCEMIGFLWSEMMQGSKSGKHISQQNRFEMNIASAGDASAINKEIGTVPKNFAAGNDQNRPISEGHCSKCSCHVSVLDKGQHICLVCNEAISTKDINSSSDMNLSSKLPVVSTLSPKVKGHGICTSGHIVDHANPNSDPSSNNGPSAPTQLISQPSVKLFATAQIKLKSNEYASTSAGDEMQFIHQPTDSMTATAQMHFQNLDDDNSNAFYHHWDDDTLNEMLDSVSMIENMYYSNHHNQTPNSKHSVAHGQSSIETATANRIPLQPKFFCHMFISTQIEKDVHEDIVSRIPPPASAHSPRILKYVKKWVDHRTFELSMQLYGSISEHVMNIPGVAVMLEQFKRNELGLLPSNT